MRLNPISALRHSRSLTAAGLVIPALASVLFLPDRHGATGRSQDEVVIVREFSVSGTIESLIGDQLRVLDADGKATACRVQLDPGKPLVVSGVAMPINAPARIEISGKASRDVLMPGMIVEVLCDVNSKDKITQVHAVTLLSTDPAVAGIVFEGARPAGSESAPARVTGCIKSVHDRKLVLLVPDGEKKNSNSLSLDATAIGEIGIRQADISMLRRGDIVKRLVVSEISSGEMIVRALEAELVGVREDLNLTLDSLLKLKYARLPDDPQPPHEVRSRNFLLRTDLSERHDAILLDKLETMLDIVSAWFGQPVRQPIECVIVSNIAAWNTADFPERGLAKIAEKQGVTFYERLGRQQRVTIYSWASDEVVMHEAVHGFCFLAFQETGPLWFAEGMAEVGRCWEPENLAIRAGATYVGYLKSTEPQSFRSIMNAATIDDELWKAYAWRWALCHLLVTNPNYAEDFRKFGVSLLRNKGGDFETAFQEVLREFEFEYQHFLQNLDAGLRADLIAWDWKTPAAELARDRQASCTIEAARGWQASGLTVTAGATYSIKSSGTWKTDPHSTAVSADGNGRDKSGLLVGTVMNDYQLTPEFDLGAEVIWTATATGILYLRCSDSMASLADNSGSLEITIRRIE